jgi:hypothetical protein
MHPERLRAIAGAAGFAEVVTNRARRREQHQCQFSVLTRERGIVTDKLLREFRQSIVRMRLRNRSKLTTAPKSTEMMGKPKQLLPERATEISYCRTHHKACVVQRQSGSALRYEAALEIRQRLSHASRLRKIEETEAFLQLLARSVLSLKTCLILKQSCRAKIQHPPNDPS